MHPLKLLIIAGARPNFMKIAPLIKAARTHNAAGRNGEPALEWRLIHTGQHYDAKMSHTFFQELGIPAPDVNLAVGSGSHAVQTANVMLGFEPVCLAEKSDWVIVVGDVNSTLACALVAVKLGIKVAHVEAGLRSFDRAMPEEINRIVTDAISDLLLTPSADADANLRREGIPARKIRLVGNIMIDSLLANLAKARQRPTLSNLGLQPGRFVYVTLHRPQNVDAAEPLSAILRELERLARELPVVFPIHPRTRKMMDEFGLTPRSTLNSQLSTLHFLDPVGYHDSLCLTENARLVLTDSGGLQEESTYFRTPCLTLRPNTERPVTITVGSNRLTSVERLAADLERILSQPPRLGQLPQFWDGQTASRVLQALTEACGASLEAPAETIVPPVEMPRPLPNLELVPAALTPDSASLLAATQPNS
jgi:UDP-N-acetylglucosamine 2-epimerase (non-hydrolysing)